MYSRSFSRRGGKDFGFGVRATGASGPTEPQTQKQSYNSLVPPPLYGGTLYIAAREGRAASQEKAVRVQTPPVQNTSMVGESRTVTYNGEPYVPNEIENYPPEEEMYGRGGYPQTGSDRPAFGKRPRILDKPENDAGTGLLGGLNLQSLFDLVPETDDIILIALIITLLSSKAAGVFSDDVLLIILGVLLLSGHTEK